jgi:hypothetical protein
VVMPAVVERVRAAIGMALAALGFASCGGDLNLDLVASATSASDASTGDRTAVSDRKPPDAPGSDGAGCDTCDECTKDDDCASHATQTLCNTGLSLCVQCLSNQDCASRGYVCDLFRFRCALPCTTDGDCAVGPPLCDVVDGYCVDCLTDGDCSMSAPRCNHGCVQCLHDSDCAGLPASPYCFPDRNLCVECMTTIDCTHLGPTAACTPKHQCRLPPASSD